jgi:hypothetical protein
VGTPGNQCKVNAVMRYCAGDQQDGYSLTGSFYHGHWNNQTDQPERAPAAIILGSSSGGTSIVRGARADGVVAQLLDERQYDLRVMIIGSDVVHSGADKHRTTACQYCEDSRNRKTQIHLASHGIY